VTRVEAGDLVVRTVLEADGLEAAPLVVRVPTVHADLLDPTATPGVAALLGRAAARGEDLQVEGPVDADMAAGAGIDAEATYATPDDGDAVGLLFSGGVASWSALLDLLDAAPPERVTHLVVVRGPADRPTPEVVAGHAAVAAELGLELVTVATSASLDAHALLGAGLQVGARFRRLLLTGAEPAVVEPLRTGRTEVLVVGRDRTRAEAVAHLRGSPLARQMLRVCEADQVPGCGRCPTCLVTMTELALAGDPDPAAGFAAPLDAAAVGALDLGPEVGPSMAAIVEGLPPSLEALRRAWSDAWDRAQGVAPRPRWGDDAPPAVSGPTVPQRVAAALRATTGQPVAPAPAPLGWRGGAVPLRPSATAHAEVRALADAAPDRPHAWAVVEPHVRDGARDGHQADLALALATHHGAGACYLPGILWAHLDAPVLDADAVRTLLRTARARLWWRATGDLEPLRVVEAVEQGCLPLQVMPVAAAQDLADALPDALAPLVVAADALAELDLSPAGVAARLDPAVDHLLAGSAEHDLLVGAYR